MSALEKIAEIEYEMARTQKNKATNSHLGLLKAKLAKLRQSLMTESTTKSGGGGGLGFEVQKSGDDRVGLIGFPSVGKSTLLEKLTGAESEVADYEFTALTCASGILNYKGEKVQILDLPDIIEGAKDTEGRGKQVISAAMSCSLILIVLDVTKPGAQREVIEKELEDFGMRLNKKPPNIVLTRKERGGVRLKFAPGCELIDTDEETIVQILREYRVFNCHLEIQCNATADDVIDVIVGNRRYIPCLYVMNKIDQIPTEELAEIRTSPFQVPISAQKEWNIDELKDEMWERMQLIQVYTKQKGNPEERKGEGNILHCSIFGTDGAQEKAQAQTSEVFEDWDLSEPFIFEEEDDEGEYSGGRDNFPSFLDRIARIKDTEDTEDTAAFPFPIPVDFQPENRREPPPIPPPAAPTGKSMKDSPPDHVATAAEAEQKDPSTAQSSEARSSSRTPLVPTALPFTPTPTTVVASSPTNRQFVGAAAATPDAAAKDTQHLGKNSNLILTAIGNNFVGSGSGDVGASFLPTSPATPAGSAFTSSPCSSPQAAGKTSSAPYSYQTPTTPVTASDLSTILYRTFDPAKDIQEKVWRYRDPQGVEQGPFSTAEMQHWNNLGYFSSVLPVQYKGVGPFFPLSSLFPEHVLPFRGQMVEITPELLAEVEDRAPVNNKNYDNSSNNNNQGPTQEWVSLAHNQGQDSNTMLGLTTGGGPFGQQQLGLSTAAAGAFKGGKFFGAADGGSYNLYSNQNQKSVNQLPHARDHDGSKGRDPHLHSHSHQNQKSVTQQHIIGSARRPGSAKGQQQNMRNAQKSGGSSSSMNPSQQGDNRNVLGGGSTVYKGYLEEAKNEQQTSNLKGLLGLNTNSYEETTGHGGLKARGGSQGGGDQNQYLNQGQGQGQYSQGQFQAQFLGQGQFQGHQGHQGQYSQGKSRDGRTPGQIQHQGQYQALGGQGQYQQGKGMGKDKDHGQRYGQTQYYLTPQDPAYMQEGHHQQFQQSHKIVMGPHDVGGGIAQLNPNQNRENKRGGNNTAKRERRRQKEKEDPYANSGYFVDGGNPSTALLQQPPLSGTTHSPPPHSSDLGRKQHGMVAPIDYSSHSHVQHHPPGGFLGATADGGDYTARRKPSILNPTEFPSLSAQSPSGGGSSTLQSDHLKSPTQQQQKPPEPEGFWERPPRPPPVVEPIEVSSPVKPTAASTTTAVSLYAPLNGSSNSPTLHVVDSSSKPNPPDALNAPESKKQQEQKELDEKAKAPRKKREKGKTVDPKLLGFVARPRGVT